MKPAGWRETHNFSYKAAVMSVGGCLRCGGTLMPHASIHGTYMMCLQCGKEPDEATAKKVAGVA
jgi:hypothetical protein